MQRDEAAVAPADHAQAIQVHVGEVVPYPVDGRQAVLHLVAPVFDGVVVLLTVAGAAAVLGADHHVAAVRGFLDIRPVVRRHVPVYPAVHPDQSRVSLGPALLQGLEDVSRDVHATDAALVDDLLFLKLVFCFVHNL